MSKRFFIAAFILIGGFFIIPPLVYPYLPCQDLPNHLVIVEYLNRLQHNDPQIEKYFTQREMIWTYSFFYRLLLFLSKAVPTVKAAKLFFSCYILLFPLSILFFITSCRPGLRWPAFLSFPLIYNDFYFLGFTNYLISLPLLFFSWGLVLRTIREKRLTYPLLLTFTGLLIPVCHPFSFFALLLFSLIVFICNRKVSATPAATVLICLLPALGLVLLERASIEMEEVFLFFPFPFNLRYLLRTPVFPFGNDLWTPLIGIFLILVLPLLLTSSRGEEPGSKPDRRNQSAVLLYAGLLLLFYFLLPFSRGSAVWLNLRIPMLIFLSLLPLAGMKFASTKTARTALLIGMTLFAARICLIHHSFNRELSPLFDLIGHMEENKALLPIMIEKGSEAFMPFYDEDFRKHQLPFQNLFVHSCAYYHLRKGGISPFMTFSPHLPWIPLKFKNPFWESAFQVTDPFNPQALIRKSHLFRHEIDYIITRGQLEAYRAEFREFMPPLYLKDGWALFSTRIGEKINPQTGSHS